MPPFYSSEPADLKYVELDEDTLTSIGRLVRAFADYEELVTLFISALAKLTASQVLIVLGRAGLSTRLQMAEHLAKITPGEDLARFRKVFDTQFFRDAHQCRNAVAHGTYLGVEPAGALAFLMDKTDEPEGTNTIQIVIGYSPDALRQTSIVAAQNVELSAEILGLRAWLKRHQPQTLRPHKKAQPRRNRGDKPQRLRGSRPASAQFQRRDAHTALTSLNTLSERIALCEVKDIIAVPTFSIAVSTLTKRAPPPMGQASMVDSTLSFGTPRRSMKYQ